MNTVTSGSKPIQLPKLNANFLAVVSLITLYSMIFLTVQPAFAWHCQGQIDDVDDATEQQREAGRALADAVDEWNNASGLLEKAKALARIAGATVLVLASAIALGIAQSALDQCESDGTHSPIVPISGGCDSDSCDDNT